MPNIENRLRRAEAATATDEARWYHVASPEIAESMWLEAKAAGSPGGVFIVYPGQAEPVIVGPTIPDLMRHVAEHGRRIHDHDRPATDDGSYLWRAPAAH